MKISDVYNMIKNASMKKSVVTQLFCFTKNLLISLFYFLIINSQAEIRTWNLLNTSDEN